ncbi:LA_0442/LA_0875 N-terminal domain-containing protein [Leptospira brenneri]|uniref:LA_0442/LA_0875 N-terminal domain-containing protein n=1 Tax=Leptospira brenneri TaxID=2023182 RepID=UPI000C29CB8D|nr:hypothetical protein [Leptospira brenneri]PJZ44883.1 hypothetical protein CH361_11515 [Leptospira brenneri]
MKKIISYFIFFLCVSFCPALRSETLLLKSGEKLEGNIVDQDKDYVTFKLADGTTKVYKKTQIKKISYAKVVDQASKKEEAQKIEKEEAEKKKIKEMELAEKQKADFENNKLEEEKRKANEEKAKRRDEELAKTKRHYLEASFGIGNGKEQSELRPFYQTIQYAGLLFSSSGQAEILTNPYKTANNSKSGRIKYVWNRFSLELKGIEAKGIIEPNGFQTLSFGSGGGSGGSSGERVVNILLGDANSKFQKVSSRIGFTPYPLPSLDLQVVGGIDRIWTSASEEVDSVGGITPTGMNPVRISYREYSSSFRGGSLGIGFEYEFLDRFTLQGQFVHISGKTISSAKNYEYRANGSNGSFLPNATGLDYWWTSKGRELNLRLSARVYNNLSVFIEASDMILKNTLQTGYISDNEGSSDQIGLKLFGPKIIIPILHDSKTILTYYQIGANYRFDF